MEEGEQLKETFMSSNQELKEKYSFENHSFYIYEDKNGSINIYI